MQFQGKITGLSLSEKGKDEDATTFLELKISAQLRGDMDVNRFVALYRKPVVIEVGELQEELQLQKGKKEETEKITSQ